MKKNKIYQSGLACLLIALFAFLSPQTVRAQDNLQPPFMTAYNDNSGAMMLYFGEFVEPNVVIYSIDYVSEQLEDKTNQRYELQSEAGIQLLGPCTVTAYTQDPTTSQSSSTVVGKYFGLTTTRIEVPVNGSVEIPAVVPVIEEADGLALNYDYDDPDNEYAYIEDRIYGESEGTMSFSFSIEENPDLESPITVLNSDNFIGNLSVTVISQDYGIVVNGTSITDANRMNVLSDNLQSVQFDGRNTLKLNNADIGSIVISSVTESSLVIYLEGTNTVQNGTYLIENQNVATTSEVNANIVFKTNADNPGSLKYIFESQARSLQGEQDAYRGCNVLYSGELKASLGTETGQEASFQTLNIVSPVNLPVIVDEEGQVEVRGDGSGLGADIENMGGTAESPQPLSTVQNDIQYEMSAEDGFYQDEQNNKLVALNTQVPVPAAGQEPDMATFKGLIFRVAAGEGEIDVEADFGPTGRLNIQIGTAAPHPFGASLGSGFKHCKAKYTVSRATNVYLYNSAVPAVPALGRRRAPGRKMTSTTSLKSVKVSVTAMASTPPPPMDCPISLTKAMVAAAKSDNSIQITDNRVCAIDADAFEGQSGVTYVDLSWTSITDASFTNKFTLDPATILLLPAGNEVSAGIKNVVIGGICNDLTLYEDRTFDIPSKFTALKVTQEREYPIGKNSTVCLPYALEAAQADKLGTFYEPTDITSGKVTMTSVTATEANKPYMFKAKESTIEAEMVTIEKPAGFIVDGADDRFKGAYQQQSILSDGSNHYYCFSEEGTFIYVTTGAVTVKPFRAYLLFDAALGRSLELDFGEGGATGIADVRSKIDNGRNVYYDLQGRRVLYPKKGIYILNGKKIVVK